MKGLYVERHWIPAGTVFGIRTGLDVARSAWRWVKRRPVLYPEFGSQTIEADDIALVEDALSSPTSWKDETSIEQFQLEFARWNGSLAAFSFMGGRVGLSACIHALKLRPGDEVVVPGYTCIVVPNAFAFAGVHVRYCDIELDTYGPDFDSLQASITSKTKALVVQHLYGLVARDYERILDFASDRKLKVIEDCAHATGAGFKGRKVGNWGDVGFYSTEQSKVLSTFNGGIAVTNSSNLVEGLREFQQESPYPDHERTRKLLRNVVYHHCCQKASRRWFMRGAWDYQYRSDILISTTEEELQGKMPAHYRQKMPPPLASLALNQLQKVDRFNDARRVKAEMWDTRCAALGLRTPKVIEGSEPVFLRYPVIVPPGRKYDTEWCLRTFGVLPGHWFTGELHPLQKVMPECPNARLAVECCLNLPTLL